MPDYTKFYNYPVFFLNCQVRTREKFWHWIESICTIKNAQTFAELYFKGDKTLPPPPPPPLNKKNNNNNNK